MIFFCTVTGARIVAPGVSKAVDAECGHDEFVEPTAVVVAVKSLSPAEAAKAAKAAKAAEESALMAELEAEQAAKAAANSDSK